jgi:hypothetical protein
VKYIIGNIMANNFSGEEFKSNTTEPNIDGIPTHPLVEGLIPSDIPAFVDNLEATGFTPSFTIEQNLPLMVAQRHGARQVFSALLQASIQRLPADPSTMTESEQEIAMLRDELLGFESSLVPLRERGEITAREANRAFAFIQDTEQLAAQGIINDIKLYRQLIDAAYLQYLKTLEQGGFLQHVELRQRDVLMLAIGEHEIPLQRLVETLVDAGEIQPEIEQEVIAQDQGTEAIDQEAVLETVVAAGKRASIS